jgi:hypothetical protein
VQQWWVSSVRSGLGDSGPHTAGINGFYRNLRTNAREAEPSGPGAAGNAGLCAHAQLYSYAIQQRVRQASSLNISHWPTTCGNDPYQPPCPQFEEAVGSNPATPTSTNVVFCDLRCCWRKQFGSTTGHLRLPRGYRRVLQGRAGCDLRRRCGGCRDPAWLRSARGPSRVAPCSPVRRHQQVTWRRNGVYGEFPISAIRWTAGLCALPGCFGRWGPCRSCFRPHNRGGWC